MNAHGVTTFIFLALLSAAAPAAVVPGASFEQRVGESLPLDTSFRDTEGRIQSLGRYFHGRPVVLWFGYEKCPQLCSVVSDGMVSTLRQLEWSAGKEFDVVMISIDPAETASAAKNRRSEAVGRYGRTPAASGWFYLTGSVAAIKQVTDAAGFHFTYDDRSQQYAHPSGFLVLTPKGRISCYFMGVDFSAKDVAAAIRRADHEGIGQKVADLLLVCFRGEGISGRYGAIIWRTLAVSVTLTVLGLAFGVGRMLWQERKSLRAEKGEGA